MIESQPGDHESWPLRAALLLALGAALGLAIHFLTRGPEIWQWTENPAKLGASAFLAAAGIVFAFSLERLRWAWSIGFAIAAGLVVGFVTYWNGQPDSWGAGEGWQLTSALLAVAIAVPLFQACRDAGRWSLDYRVVHAHAWTNIVLWFVAWGFVLITYLLVHLLSELFQLIGIHVLRDLLRKDWFGWLLIGGALGGAVGLLRDRDRILGLLQRVATAILSVLAPILAVGLVIFVAALPFTGLEPLWEQTRATTPILLACIIGAVILVNAAIGSGADEVSGSRIVRWAAAALAAVTLPLAVVAALSTGKRIAQHGFTPDRLWAAVFVAITVIGAAAYLFAVARGRAGWPALLRSLNLRLAVGICLVALFLALPIVNFGAVSTRDQLARLQSGRIAPDKFDWAALRYDFGPSGRRAVERLARSADPVIRDHARAALAAKSRWDARRDIEAYGEAPRTMRVVPAGVAVPPDLREAVLGRPGRPGACVGKGDCYLLWRPGQSFAIVVIDSCPASPPPGNYCELRRTVVNQHGGRWVRPADEAAMVPAVRDSRQAAAALQRQRQALRRGEVELREVSRRQLFIGGYPVEAEFE
ncbi:MAG TPA: DUF4153 domain-containing protein [Allosphingosinicella sp.]|nr:DUF4153 domain-containing protein [Allosphingosinicella sp.]